MRTRFHAVALVLATALIMGGVAAPAVAQAVTDVTVGDNFFEPDVVQVAVGETVRWTNQGRFEHTVTAEENATFDAVLAPGETFEHTFTEEVAVPYFCRFHPGMEGQVVVGDAQPSEGAFPAPTGQFERLEANDNVEAALAWSRRSFADGSAETVLLARSDLFADSLTSGPVQGHLNAPLLLTPPGQTDPRVAAELDRLGATRVIIFGGEATGVQSYGRPADRIAGTTRIETATDAASKQFPQAEHALLVRAFGDEADPTRAFADSLGAGAAGAQLGVPVLLTQTEELTGSTRAYLQQSQIKRVTIVGGAGAVSPAVQSAVEGLGIEVDRVSGANRFATASNLLLTVFQEGPPRAMLLVEGSEPNAWASGFAAAATAARGAGLVLTNGPALPSESTWTFLLARIYTICGPFVDDSACDQAQVVFGAGFVFAPERAAILTGEEEVPSEGDPDASGFAAIVSTDDADTICFAYVSFGRVPTAAHIHTGQRGEAGPPVVTLGGFAPFDPGFVLGCAFDQDQTVIQDILANPQNYYVNVHTEEFPEGAIRGQLFEPTAQLAADLSGEAVVPGPGAEAGGFAEVFASEDETRLCAIVETFGLEQPATAAHIHQGAEGEQGPVVVTLPTPDPEVGAAAGCAENLDPALVRDIVANPGNYYVQVHNEQFPQGAIRGQLSGPPPGE